MATKAKQASITNFFGSMLNKESAAKTKQGAIQFVPGMTFADLSCVVPIPDVFPFPFEPYDIQDRFMRKLYETLSDGKLGIFESPTGTGKSLSIICGALTWLRDFENKRRRDLEEGIKEEKKKEEIHEMKFKQDDGDWFREHHEKLIIEDELSRLQRRLAEYQKLDEKMRVLKERKVKVKVNAKAVNNKELTEQDENDCENSGDCDDEYLLKEYVSDDEENEKSCELNVNILDEIDLEGNMTKIYFCSRTHSQLAQFAQEVKKSPFANDVRVVTLGSRQNSCVNEAVLKLKTLSMMNDRCRELKKNKGKETKVSASGEILKKKKSHDGCPFYRSTQIEELSDLALVEVKDIEELAGVARKIKACPYYASRNALPMAQLVLLPYNTLLHKQTREASGISLYGNVVIVDEAHNLLDAISAIHSSQVTGSQLSGALSQLAQYKERYSTRLKAKNVFYIQQIIFVLKSMLKYLKGLTPTEKATEEPAVKMHTLNQFILATGLENINPYKILNYCEKSKITRKLLGFSTIYQPTVKPKALTGVGAFLDKLAKGSNETSPLTPPIAETEPEVKPATSPLMQVVEFLRTLTNRDRDGRIVMNQQNTLEASSFKYYLLNPAAHFRDIVAGTRAVVLAGGTMQPMEEFSDHLFEAAGAPKERIIQFSCGHVIPSNHLLAMALSQGPSGVNFDFSYQNRNSPSLIDELGRFITNVCNVIPGGIVCFFPSYDYAAQVLSRWETSNILDKIGIKKQVFREARTTNMTNKVLADYTKFIRSSSKSGRTTGAILFSVVGGKMSEGINFSDDLGRCVVMVGMPYANIKSVELQEKMKYLNQAIHKSTDDRQPGQVYYENLCMKAVNQSIGRAIRHRLDYATIMLLDTRYSKPSVQKALPGWIKNHLKTCPKFGPAFALVRKFFTDHKSASP